MVFIDSISVVKDSLCSIATPSPVLQEVHWTDWLDIVYKIAMVLIALFITSIYNRLLLNIL